MTTRHEDNIEQCKEVFVDWTKAQRIAIGVLVAALLSMASVTWAAATIVINNDTDHIQFRKSLVIIEGNTEKLDRILKLLGEQHVTSDNR